jgi:hypothetical protein
MEDNSGGWDLTDYKAMINADDPEALYRQAVDHYKLAREIQDVAYELDVSRPR